MGNKCKKEGCLNEALIGNKYCNYHEAKRQQKIKEIVKLGKEAIALSLTISLGYKKFFK